MASIINADSGISSSVTGITFSADNSGALNIQTNGVTAIAISSSQAVSFPATTSLNFGSANITTLTSSSATITNLIATSASITTLTNNPTFGAGTANGMLYLNGSKVITSGSAVVFDGTNMGLGVTPSAWNSNYKVIEGAAASGIALASANVNPVLLGSNWFVDSVNKYKTSAAAALFEVGSGAFKWYNAPSGTAGSTISFTQAMTLTADGNLGIGTTSPNVSGQSSSVRVLTVQGPVTWGGVEVSTSTTDGEGYLLGFLGFAYPTNSVTYRLPAYIGAWSEGATANQRGASLRFFTQSNATAGAVERARFNTTGAFVFAGGTTTADGIGITFPATQSASSNVNTLDDYEEGDWTPTGLNVTFSSAIGRYNKIGRQVTVWWEVVWPTTSNTDAARISGLPFTVSSNSWSGGLAITNVGISGILAFVHGGQTNIFHRSSSNDDYLNNQFSGKFSYGCASYIA